MKTAIVLTFFTLFATHSYSQVVEKSTTKNKVQFIAKKQISFPQRGAGQLAGWLFYKGNPEEELTNSQRRESYCQVLPTFLKQTTEGQVFAGEVPAEPFVDNDKVIRIGITANLQSQVYRGESIGVEWVKVGGRGKAVIDLIEQLRLCLGDYFQVDLIPGN